jgi:hypothetical protein
MLSIRTFSTRRVTLCAAVAGLCAVLGCETNTGTALDKKSTQGAILGGLAGAAAGRAIGGHEHDTEGILIGAAGGAVAGGLIGHYLDKQAQELDAIPDANVEQRDDVLIVGFQGDVLFDSGSSVLHAGAYSRLETLADTLKRYPRSRIRSSGILRATSWSRGTPIHRAASSTISGCRRIAPTTCARSSSPMA